MSASVLSKAWISPTRLTAEERLLLITLADSAHDDGEGVISTNLLNRKAALNGSLSAAHSLKKKGLLHHCGHNLIDGIITFKINVEIL